MNKLFGILVAVVIGFYGTQPAFAAKPVTEIYGGVSDGQLIFYSFKTNKWYYQKPKQRPKKILEVVRREVSEDEYSDYVSPKGHVYSPAGSNYEFLYRGRLITYHYYDDKFFEIIYYKPNKDFIEIPLEEKEIKKITGKPKIIHISDFNDEHKIVVRKLPLKRQTYLLLNDTDKYFYRYFLSTSQKDSNIKTLFYVKKPSTIMFSHYVQGREEFPPYEIKIKNGF